MFTCNACLRRAILSLASELVPTQPVLPSSRSPFSVPRLRTFNSSSASVRSHATVQSLRTGHHRHRAIKLLNAKNLPPPNRSRSRIVPVVEVADSRARLNNAQHLLEPAYEQTLRRKAEYEAQFLEDPLKLANATLEKLRGGHFLQAYNLVVASEKRVVKKRDNAAILVEKRHSQNVVSWNHLIDYSMEKGDLVEASKTYNEMKKRGHRPDAHTYTIMLRGFAQNVQRPDVVQKAVSVYDSIYAANSTVKPSTIHTNAVINVCARARNMDALWAVAGRIPESGPGSPDKWTYTTILNAIQGAAKTSAAQLMSRAPGNIDTAKIFEEAISDGRKLWRDIIVRWQKGDIGIDERLVCAMGRLLLISTKNTDIADVFRLVEQTMNIKLGDVGVSTQDLGPNAKAPEAAEADFTPMPTKKELQITATTTTSIYAVPGQNTLSMLMEATLLSKQAHKGKAYWKLLTSDHSPYRIVPDTQNVVSYLRLLRISRASKEILDLLRRKWPEEVEKTLFHDRGTYVIAMSTCVRDKNNPNVFETAGRIFDIMQEKTNQARDVAEVDEGNNAMYRSGQLMDMDPKVLTMYLNLAMVTTKGINPSMPLMRKHNSADLDFERDPGLNNTFKALRRLGADVINVKRLAKMKITEVESKDMPKSVYPGGWKKQDPSGAHRVGERLEDLAGLMKAMTSAYDRILAVNFKLENEGMGPLDLHFVEDCRLQKQKLSAFLAKVDRQTTQALEKGGVWKGYETGKENAKGAAVNHRGSEEHTPAEVASQEAENGFEDSTEEGGEIKVDSLVKTSGMAQLQRMVWQKAKKNETWELNRRLSRRQVQEKEKERRAERTRKMYPPKPRNIDRSDRSAGSSQHSHQNAAMLERNGRSPGSDHRNEDVSGVVQRAWGGGYDQMATQMGHPRSKVMELKS